MLRVFLCFLLIFGTLTLSSARADEPGPAAPGALPSVEAEAPEPAQSADAPKEVEPKAAAADPPAAAPPENATPAEQEQAKPPEEAPAEAVPEAAGPAPSTEVVSDESADDAAPPPFSFEGVVENARVLASKPFDAPDAEMPDALANASYDAYRQIAFRPERGLWRDEAMFQVQFFHLGFLYRQPVRINVVDGGVASELTFDPAMFNYRKSSLEDDVAGVNGFAGFKVLFPLAKPDKMDEVAVFLGASYFRLLGRGQVFGASARGLAVDTALSRGEEFPFFREFWLQKPGPEDLTLTLYALLDSQRLTGAYRFVIDPGTATVVDVQAHVFAREDLERVGLAPLTSMFLFGDPGLRTFNDFRPEVHDSEGLLMVNGNGEWIWRALGNPRELRVSSFKDTNPRGFGLLQRDREFDSYLDLEAEYHRRPGLWVEPVGDWGEGAVQLVEIPSDEEIHDNIVAYWVAAEPWRAGQTRQFQYRLFAVGELPFRLPLAHVVRTRIGSARVPGQESRLPPDARLFVIDYNGGDLPYLSSSQPLQAKISANRGEILEQTVGKIRGTGGWRVAFRLDPQGSSDVDMTLKLSLYGEPVAETWTFRWSR